MADPLSITTGIVGLLTTCLKIGTSLKEFHDSLAVTDTKIRALLADVESFSQVLKLMKDTFEDQRVQASFQVTGHIGNHWKALSTTIQDGQSTLVRLQETLEKVDKSVTVLDGPRRHFRLRGALEEISVYQLEIRSYRDTLQLSLQTVILWNQVTAKESTDKVSPSLDELNVAIRQIACDINNRISNLQNIVQSSGELQLEHLQNLRNCVQSAASVVSSASTILTNEHSEALSVTHDSEFGECFPPQPGETMLRWISSNTVYEFDENPLVESSLRQLNMTTVEHEPKINDSESESDDDLEIELFDAMLESGREKLEAEDFKSADRLFKSCLTKISSNDLKSRHIRMLKPEIMKLLLDVHMRAKKWDDAHSLLLEMIALESRKTATEDDTILTLMLTLVEVLMRKVSYAEALLYARRALKGYRRLGTNGTSGVIRSLDLLIKICDLCRNNDERDAYTVIRSKIREGKRSRCDAVISLQVSEGKIASALASTQPAVRPNQEESTTNFGAEKPDLMETSNLNPPIIEDDRASARRPGEEEDRTPPQEVAMTESEYTRTEQYVPRASSYPSIARSLTAERRSEPLNNPPTTPRSSSPTSGVAMLGKGTDSAQSVEAQQINVYRENKDLTGSNRQHSEVSTATNSTTSIPRILRSPEMFRKLVLVGDSGCGKTALLNVYNTGVLPETNSPTVAENYAADILVDGKLLELAIWDTSGLEDFDKLRPLSYHAAHIVLICFSIVQPVSLSNVLEKWHPEIEKHAEDTPFLLVGLQRDLRFDSSTINRLRKAGLKPVTWEEGQKVGNQIGAHKYLECSAKGNTNVKDVFDHAIRAALSEEVMTKNKRSKRSKRTGDKTGGLWRRLARSAT